MSLPWYCGTAQIIIAVISRRRKEITINQMYLEYTCGTQSVIFHDYRLLCPYKTYPLAMFF